MAFGSPIVGSQGRLLREEIASPDYVAGVSGWVIRKDGSAEFNEGEFRGQARVTSPSGAEVGLEANATQALVSLMPPDETGFTWTPAEIMALVNTAVPDRYPFLFIGAPNEGGESYATIELSGGTPARQFTNAYYASDEHGFQLAEDTGQTDGTVALDSAMSFDAVRHRPLVTEMVSQPVVNGTGVFVAFSNAQWPALQFRTGVSGRVVFTINMAGMNSNSGVSTLATSFALSGGSVVVAALGRSALVRSPSAAYAGGFQAHVQFPLDLVPNSDYTLTPAWRTSGATAWGAAQFYDLNYQNSISVEPST